MNILQSNNLLNELEFSFSRSGGPGGQNVNKVNSKVTLKWDLVHSNLLSDEIKVKLTQKLSSKLTKEGVLMLVVQDHRSQLQNKQAAIQKLDFILRQALTTRKARKATKPSKSAGHKRLFSKKRHSEKKSWRRKSGTEG